MIAEVDSVLDKAFERGMISDKKKTLKKICPSINDFEIKRNSTKVNAPFTVRKLSSQAYITP